MKIRMKRKNIIYIIVAVMMIAAICVSAGVVQHRKDKKAAEKAAMEAAETTAKADAEKQVRKENNSYTRYLYIKGEFSYEGNKIHAQNLKYNDNKLMVDLGFVNACNENQFTIEQLYEEYEAFLNGENEKRYKNLNEYVNCISDVITGSYTIKKDYDVYVSEISKELWLINEEKRKNGEDVSAEFSILSASPEDVRRITNYLNLQRINDKYTRWLYIEGDFTYEGSYEKYKVSVENPEYNDKLLMVDVEYVNLCNGNEKYTVEQLYEEYERFLNGEDKEEYKALDEYLKDFDSHRSFYDDYCASVNDEIELIREEKRKKGEQDTVDNKAVREALNRVSVQQIMYADRLYIKGDFSYEEYKLSAENPKYNDKLLMIDVAFVNACNENQQYTIEQLYEEYEAYINGESKDKYNNLEKYIEIIGYYRDGSVYDDYCNSVYDEMKSMRKEKQKKGEEIIIDNESKKETRNNRRDVSSARVGIVGGSPEEIREAINYVNEREISAIHMLELVGEVVSKSEE